jgi:2-phosphoglycerate kinase
MAKAYLIGATPRTGKTTLTLRFIESHPVMAASTDAIRYMLRRVVTEESEPDLFHLGKYTSNDPKRRERLNSRPQEIVDIQISESCIVWQAASHFIKSNLEVGFDVLVEGIAVMPGFLQDADFDYSAVFLGNQSEQHAETILKSARNNPNDWMHTLEDETIAAFAKFNQAFSRHVQEEANEFGLPYVEVRDDCFNDDISAALNLLHK